MSEAEGFPNKFFLISMEREGIMLWKKWVFAVLFILITAGLSATIAAKIVSDIYEKEIADYIGILNSSKQFNESAEPAEKGIEKIYVGVVISDKNLIGDGKKDRVAAENHLSKKRSWTYITTERVAEHSVFIFETSLSPKHANQKPPQN